MELIKFFIISTICLLIFINFSGFVHAKDYEENDFSFNLFSQIESITDTEKNIFFSPYSIKSALTMTYIGSAEQTKEEMSDILGLNDDLTATCENYSTIEKKLAEVTENEKIELSTANALWINKDYKLKKEYLNLVKKYFKAGLHRVNYKSAPNEAVNKINKWVEKKTKDKITELLRTDDVSELTRLILTNAIYFLGTWQNKFDEHATREMPFWVSQEKNIKVPMMVQTENFPFAETDNFKILELPYKGREISMIILLPKDKNTISNFANYIVKNNIFKTKMEYEQVKVLLPKFKITERYNLKRILKSMGMKDAFSPKVANFSNLTEDNDLFINKVIHKAFIDVDEKGTEAAAATAVVMELKSAAPPKNPKLFKADHPFFFVIQENSSNEILFMGKLNKPETSN